MKINPWLGIALFAVCFGANAQGIHKCVGKDGKTAYSNDPCPGSKEIQAAPPAVKGPATTKPPAGPAAADVSGIPEVQVGKWKTRAVRENGGAPSLNETCGDPIAGFRRQVQAYTADTKSGCTLEKTALGPRSVRFVHDCPSDRAPDGRRVQKGRSEMTLASASPQAFRIEMKSTGKLWRVTEGTRTGDCEANKKGLKK